MPLEMKYFVLKPQTQYVPNPHAKASIEAMIRYAEVIDEYDVELAIALRGWAERELKNYSALYKKQGMAGG
jgi:hypothetical protein